MPPKVKGVPTGSRANTFVVDPETGLPIFTPYVWNNLTQEYEQQAVLSPLHADGGQLVHVTNPNDFPAGSGGSSGGLTDTQLRATPVPVSGTLDIADRAGRVVGQVSIPGGVAVTNWPSSFGVSGNVEVVNDVGNPLPVSGPLTDTQLRANAVPVSLATVPSHAVTGPLTDTQLRASAVPVAGPLTDTQLRATPVPVTTGLILPASLDADGGMKVHVQNPTSSVSVANFPASQPVTGPLTDTQLRAAAVPVSLATVPSHAVTGPLTNTELRASPVPISGTVAIGAGTTATYKGRACGFRTPARVALTQPIFTFWNGSASKICRIKYVGVDAISTAIKAATVIPALVRFYRCTAAPTNGATVTKAPEDSTLTSDANIIIRCDASADGTIAASALAATAVGGALTQEYAPRLITAAGYEMFDKSEFFQTSEIVLRPSEGLIVRLEAPANMVITDHYIVNTIWTEE